MTIMRHLRVLVVFLLLIFWLIEAGKVSAQPEADRTFSLSCRSASLRDVLAQLALQKGINLAGLDSIDKGLTITTHLDAVPFEAGLKALLEPKGYTFEKRGTIYFIEAAAQAQRTLSLEVSDGKLTLDAIDIDVNQVIGALATQGISIASRSDLTGSITAHLIDQPIDKALPILFSAFTLLYTDGIYKVTPRSTAGSGRSTVLIQGDRISLWSQDASLAALLFEVAERLKINLSVVGEIDRPVTVLIKNKPLDELLGSLAQMTGHSYRSVDTLHFFGKAHLNQEGLNPLIERKTIWLKHLKAQDVLNLLPADIPKQNVTVSEPHNTVTVAGPAALIASIEQFLLELDIDNDAIRGRQPQGTIAIAVDGDTQRLTVDFKNAPLFDVVRQLAIETGIDVVFLGMERETVAETDKPSQRDTPPLQALRASPVTLRRTDATLEMVLSALFLESSYTYKWTDAPKPMLIVGDSLSKPFAEEELIPLNYLSVPKVMELLLAPRDVGITTLPSRNALLVSGSRKNIDLFRQHLKKVDVPQPQATIQLYLLELTHGNRDELGLSLATASDRTTIHLDDGVGVNFDSVLKLPQAFSAKLTALVEQNRAKVLANPSLAVVNGQKASIDIGGKHLFETNNPIYPPISGTYNPGQTSVKGVIPAYPIYSPSTIRSHFTIETGLMLELTPLIGAQGEVTLDIQLAIRDADQLSREASSLSQRLITTTISVADQGMVVIGGLLQEKEIKNVRKVPVLNRVPLLGKYLFTSTETTLEQTELIVIIQPKVIQK